MAIKISQRLMRGNLNSRILRNRIQQYNKLNINNQIEIPISKELPVSRVSTSKELLCEILSPVVKTSIIEDPSIQANKESFKRIRNYGN